MEKIGFVGTGAMGSALLSRLKLANVTALAFDIAPAALQAARNEGAETVSSAKAIAQACTMIEVVVRTDQEVLQCVLGNDGVLEGAAPAPSSCCTAPYGPPRRRKSPRPQPTNGSMSSMHV
jgi:3-hydroxyisobutyrate dehydrogenase-like beta-hydroxyacid dehydrogenase